MVSSSTSMPAAIFAFQLKISVSMTSCCGLKVMPAPRVPAPPVTSAPAAVVLSAAKASCVQACQSGSWLVVRSPPATSGRPTWAASCAAASWKSEADGPAAGRPATAGSAA